MRSIGFILLSFLFFTASAHAESELYMATVSTNVVAENSAKAREKAMSEASRQALFSVVNKIANNNAAAKFSHFNDEQIMNFIQETSVIEEKTTANSYIAELKFVINKDLLKSYLSEQNINFAIEETKNIVLIPVYRESPSTKPLLWEENPWFQTWENKAIKKNIITFRGISRSLDGVVSTDDVLSLNGEAFSRIAEQSKTKDIYIIEAINMGDGLNVKITSYQNGVLGTVHPKDTKEAISVVANHINDSIKKQNIIDGSQKSEITAVYTYSSLKDWVTTEKKLKSIAQISKIDIDAIGDGKVQFKLLVLGSLEGLSKVLNQHGFEVEEAGDFYVIKNIGY